MTIIPIGLDPAALRKIDINKLVVFMTIYQDGSVSRAAARLGLGQPAVSNVLNDLRKCFDDILFVRIARMMKPTARAEQIAACLLPILNALMALIQEFTSESCREAGANKM